jgi:hypothetical protein
VQVYVNHQHPLLQLKGALPWEAIEALMVAAWRKAGKNVAGSRGKAWPVSLYSPFAQIFLTSQKCPKTATFAFCTLIHP